MSAELTPEQELANWRAQRLSYPGWLILPETNRSELVRDLERGLSRGLAHGLLIREPPNWPLEVRFDAWFELNWRLERALYPLHPSWAERLEGLLAEAAPFASLLDKEAAFFREEARKAVAPESLRSPWIALAVAVLRHHREFRHRDAFFAWLARLAPLKGDWDEIHHQCAYQEALWHVTFMDDAKALEPIEGWQVERGCDPYWLARKAGLLAELGRRDEAIALWQDCRRRLQGFPTDRSPYFATSRESAVLSVLTQISWREEEFGLNQPRDRLRELTGIHGWGHWEELAALSKFDMDRREKLEEMEVNTNTIYVEGYAPWKPLEGAQCFRFAEDLGFPFRVSSDRFPVRLGISAAQADSLADLALASEDLAGTSLLRMREEDFWKKRMDGSHMAAIPDHLLADLLTAIDNAWRRIESADLSAWELERQTYLASGILNQMISRMDGEQCRDWLLRLLPLAKNQDFRRYFRIPYAMRDVINGLASRVHRRDVMKVLPEALAFPLPEEANTKSHMFPDPLQHLPLPEPGGGPLPEACRSRIEELVRQVPGNSNALAELCYLAEAGLLPDNLKATLANAIWANANGLPDIGPLFYSALLALPEPEPGHAERALKALFVGTPPVNLASADQKQITYKATEWALDLHYLCPPYRDNRHGFIQWSADEADAILSHAETWWRSEGAALAKKWGPNQGLKRRIYHLNFALARSIAPALSPGSTAGKTRLPKLLDEIEAAGFPVLTARPLLLRFRIGDAASMMASLLNGLRSEDDDAVHDALWGAIHWCELQKSARLPALPHRLIEEMLIFLAARAEGQSAAEIVGTIEAILAHSPNILSKRAKDLLELALDALQMRTRYPKTWHQRDGQRFSEVVKLRRNAVLLASAIHKAGISEAESVRYWLEVGQSDPLPEVRQALKT